MARNQAMGGIVAVYNNLRRASGHGMGHKRDRRHHPEGYGGIGLALDLAVSPSAAVGMAVNNVRACPDIIDGNADITNAPPQLVPSLCLCLFIELLMFNGVEYDDIFEQNIWRYQYCSLNLQCSI